MKFTFGVITSDIGNPRLQKVLDSITDAFIFDQDSYEVIIVGGNQSYQNDNYKIIPFDESKRNGWITKKKNIVTENATYDNIVYMHDYVALDREWFNGFLGMDYDVCITPIKNADGTRYRDWTLWPNDLTHVLGEWNGKYLLPYDVTHLSKYMYFSGAYWVAKKKVMEEFPLDESLSWGESEDVKWSKQVREKYKFSINPHSHVRLLKQKDRVFNEITPEMLKTINDYDLRLRK